MTTLEHALLGVNAALALGLHKRFGWRVVPLAAIAAVAPDWDGIPMLFDMARFESGHRVWGHNVLACAVVGLLLVVLDHRFNYTGWIAKQFAKLNSKGKPASDLTSVLADRGKFRWISWFAIATTAALTQIPADLVVSGGSGLSNWPLKPLWPFSTVECVYPLVPWGNVGVTVIFAIAMLGQAKFPSRAQSIAIGALASMTAYILLWGNLINA